MSEPAAVIANDAGSAPVVEETTPVNPVESGTTETVVEPVTTPPETTDDDGSAPLGEKGQKELINLRKRAQNAEALVEYFRNQHKVPAPQPIAPVVPPVALVQPKEEDFQSWDEWNQADKKYNIELAKAEIRQEFSAQSMQGVQQRVESQWTERLQKEAEQDPTILEALKDDTLTITPFTAALIKDSDVGPKILKYLDNNRAEAIRIAGLAPVYAAREIGKIEAKIAATPAPQPPKKVSQAPEPIKTVTPVGTPVVDENNLSIEEWMQRRNEAQFKPKTRSK